MALDFILVPSVGMKGAAVASCIGYTFSGLFSLSEFSKQSGWSFKQLLFVKKEDIERLQNMLRDKWIANG
jgi:Na+-driven multidrug efflux pump